MIDALTDASYLTPAAPLPDPRTLAPGDLLAWHAAYLRRAEYDLRWHQDSFTAAETAHALAVGREHARRATIAIWARPRRTVGTEAPADPPATGRIEINAEYLDQWLAI